MNGIEQKQHKRVTDELDRDLRELGRLLGNHSVRIDDANKRIDAVHAALVDSARATRTELIALLRQDITDEFTAAMDCVGRIADDQQKLRDAIEPLTRTFWGVLRWLVLGR